MHKKAPEGINKTQKLYLKKVANEYATKVFTSALSHKESQQYYDACYLKLVGYVLGKCFLNTKDLEEIEHKAIRVFTAKCGYN